MKDFKRWIVCDLHTHSLYSDGNSSPQTLVTYALRRGVQLFAVTDHDSIKGSQVARAYVKANPSLFEGRLGQCSGLEVMLGSEITSKAGHIVALGITEDIAPCQTAEATIAAIHEQGGVAIAAHPYSIVGRFGVDKLIQSLPFDAVEINGSPSELVGNWKTRRENTQHLPLLGNSDAHVKTALGDCRTIFPLCGEFETLESAWRDALARGQTRPVGGFWDLASVVKHIRWFIHRVKENDGRPDTLWKAIICP